MESMDAGRHLNGVCRYHLENSKCQLSGICVGEASCILYQLEAERLCPSCNKRGAEWSSYGEHGGLKYTCWNCGHVWTELFTRSVTPGVCLRCGKAFVNPVPPVTVPSGDHEIACEDWCAKCNAFTMSIIRRWSTAYKVELRSLRDPLKGGE